MEAFKKISGYFILAVFLVFLAFLFYFVDEIYIERAVAGQIEFRIEKGESLSSVISRLEELGLARNVFLAKVYVYFSGLNEAVKPGVYSIGPRYSVKAIFDDFIRGSEVEVRIFEGWTSKDISLALKETGVIKKPSVFTAEQIANALGVSVDQLLK